MILSLKQSSLERNCLLILPTVMMRQTAGSAPIPAPRSSLKNKRRGFCKMFRKIIGEGVCWNELDIMKHPQRIVLVTPLGTSPGTLYSVLCHSIADQVVVLTSKEGAIGIDEAKRAAGFSGKISVVLVDDPFRCFDTKPILERCRKLITTPPPRKEYSPS